LIPFCAYGLRVRAQVLKRMTSGARPLCRLSRDQRRALVEILEVLLDESGENRDAVKP
jgi:hypothetical protein